MFTVLKKEVVAEKVKRMEILAPDVARKAAAGQFVVLRVSARGERIPITVTACDQTNGSITLIFQEVGKTTGALGRLKPGEAVMDLLGPLGHPTEPVQGKTIVTVGGGVGVAEVLPVSRLYKQLGNKVIGIVGARNRDLVILEKDMAAACDRLIVTTDDGSSGRKGFVTDILKDLFEQGVKPDLVYAIGPMPMMRAVSALTKPFGIKTMVSLNPIMIDGTGMCGSCRVTVGNVTKFACVDGPEFDGHAVVWEELIQRLGAFREKEKAAIENHRKECICNQHASL